MDTKQDDLTLIKGIGTNRQQWLRDNFHIRTYADLAALSEDDIEAQLKMDGQIVSRAKIEAWLAHARQLAAAESLPGARRHLSSEDGWKPFASFVVEFQEHITEDGDTVRRTSAHHMEADRGEVWPEIALDSLSAWMAQQLGVDDTMAQSEEEIMQTVAVQESASGVPEPEQTTAHARMPAPTAEPMHQPPFVGEESLMPLRMNIIRLEVFQPPDSGQPSSIMMPSQILSGFVQAGKPFTFCAVFKVVGVSAKKPTSYSAQFYAYNLDTRDVTYLGYSQPAPFVEGDETQTIILPGVMLEAGLYRLQVVAKLEGTPTLGYLEVPMFQVV